MVLVSDTTQAKGVRCEGKGVRQGYSHVVDGAGDGHDTAVGRDDERMRRAVVVGTFVKRAVVLPVVVSARIVNQFAEVLRPSRV